MNAFKCLPTHMAIDDGRQACRGDGHFFIKVDVRVDSARYGRCGLECFDGIEAVTLGNEVVVTGSFYGHVDVSLSVC